MGIKDIFMRFALRMVAAATALASPSANAAVFVITGTGTVNSIASLDNGVFDPTYNGTGGIALGDAMQFSFEIDTDQAVLTPTFDSDPTVNVYYFCPTKFSVSIGSYNYNPSFSFIGDGSLQTWNDRVIVSDPVDGQSFTFNGRGTNALPFDLGSGTYLESITFYAFDNSATARQSDIISELPPYSAFDSLNFSWLQYNQTLGTSIHVGGLFNGQIRNAPVPEPATWAMMLMGFGMVGGALRRKRKGGTLRFERATAV
jgi:hypothetical protein